MPDNFRVPVVWTDPKGFGAFSVFNPNKWSGISRGVVQSCANELAALLYTRDAISELCSKADEICRPRFAELSANWADHPWDRRAVYFIQVPLLHVLIEGFFSGLKSLLDLVVQLISSEQIVDAHIHGFHEDGRKLLRILERNAKKARAERARAITKVITTHKEKWIDDTIKTRDALVHPTLGAQQLMFHIEVEYVGDHGTYLKAWPPHIGSVPIDRYATDRLNDIREFSLALLTKLAPAA